MHSVFIIAEAGVNHNGVLPIALKMIDAAVAAGALKNLFMEYLQRLNSIKHSSFI